MDLKRLNSRLCAVFCLAFTSVGVLRAIAQMPEQTKLLATYGKRDISVHDPSSLVKCDDNYWFYSTGMLIKSYRSKDLETWTRGPAVFDAMPSWVKEVVPDQKGHFWAPDIIRIGNRYLLYYSVSTFGKQTSAIALATNVTLDPESPDYSWIDRGIVIRTDESDDFMRSIQQYFSPKTTNCGCRWVRTGAGSN